MIVKCNLILAPFIRVILCFLILVTTSSCAKDLSAKELSAKDLLSIDFNKLRTAQAATFVLVPWSDLSWIKPFPKWDEATFKQLGCTFRTEDQARIGSLIMILQRADLKKAPVSDVTFKPANGNGLMTGTRLGVYLIFADGSEAKFLIGGELPSSDTQAVFTFPPKFQDYLLYGNTNLPWYLTFWASQLGKPSGQVTSRDIKVQNTQKEWMTLKGTIDPAYECEKYIRKNIYLQF